MFNSATPWTAVYQDSVCFTISLSLLRLMSLVLMMPYNHLISRPLSPPCPPALNLSQHQGLFQRVGSLPRWPKYWSYSFSVSPSSEYSGLTSFRMDCLIVLLSKGLSRVFYGTIIQKLQFLIAQLSLWSNSHICT